MFLFTAQNSVTIKKKSPDESKKQSSYSIIWGLVFNCFKMNLCCFKPVPNWFRAKEQGYHCLKTSLKDVYKRHSGNFSNLGQKLPNFKIAKA